MGSVEITLINVVAVLLQRKVAVEMAVVSVNGRVLAAPGLLQKPLVLQLTLQTH